MSAFDGRTKLEALRDQMETLGKGANYLLVGHSAGFVSCLAIVREHPENLPPRLQGLELLILLFGSGLLLASVLWICSMATKISVTQKILSGEGYSQKWLPWLGRKVEEYFALLSLWGSLGFFMIAIVLIMSRFRDALPFTFRGI